jgi:hypothetical protein
VLNDVTCVQGCVRGSDVCSRVWYMCSDCDVCSRMCMGSRVWYMCSDCDVCSREWYRLFKAVIGGQGCDMCSDCDVCSMM